MDIAESADPEGPDALYVDGAAAGFLRELGCEPRGCVPDAGARC